MIVVTKRKPEKKEVGKITGPSFRDPATMTEAELTDPDYAKKQLVENFGGTLEAITCSRCHHCRVDSMPERKNT